MAWTYQTATNNGSSTSPSVTLPATIAAGSVIYIDTQLNSTTPSISEDSGTYTENDTERNGSQVFYRIAETGSEGGGTVNFTLTSSAFWRIAVVVATPTGGVAAFNTSGHQLNSSTTTHTCPSVNASNADSVLFCRSGSFNTAGSITVPSGMTQRHAITGSSSIGVATKEVSSGATGTQDFTWGNALTGRGRSLVFYAVPSATITGVVAASPAAALAPTIASFGAATVSSVVAAATAAGLAATIVAQNSNLIAAEPATSDAEVLIATILSGHTIGPPAAEADAEVLESTITAVRILTIAGELATADAEVLEAVITSQRSTTVDPPLSEADAEALPPIFFRSATIAGAVATATAAAGIPVVTARTLVRWLRRKLHRIFVRRTVAVLYSSKTAAADRDTSVEIDG